MNRVVEEVNAAYLVETAEGDVPAGYKKTELGVIPGDWEIQPLKEVALFAGGTTPSRDLFERYYASGSHPWVKTLDLNNGLIEQTEEYVTDVALSETSLKMHPVGAVLVAMYGGFNQIGRVGLLKINAAINQALIAVVPKKEKLNPEYLLHHLNFNVDYWKSVASSSRKDPNITSGDVKDFVIPIPRMNEQIKIAKALTDIDKLISSLEKLITKKYTAKAATMQQLLTGRSRLPQFVLREDGSPKGFKSSELGDIPEDWNVKTLGEVAEVKSGGTPSTIVKDYWGGSINWCTPTDITALQGQKYLKTTARKITDFGLAKSGVELFPAGTIVMTSRATIGECAIATSPITTNQGFKNFLCVDDTNNEFLYYLLGTLKARLIGLCSGSTFLEISTQQVKNLSVVVPRNQEQAAIAHALSNMDDDIQKLQQRVNKTRQLKQGMMQQLLTGKIRLVQPAKVRELIDES